MITMLSPKSKAEQDAIIATGLLPVSCAVDYLATLVWLFGGLLETDAVWAYRTIGRAKTSRSVTKRLASTSETDNHNDDRLTLSFTPSARFAWRITLQLVVTSGDPTCCPTLPLRPQRQKSSKPSGSHPPRPARRRIGKTMHGR